MQVVCWCLTLHESQQYEGGQARHGHGEQQDAPAAAPIHRRPQQQPGPAPGAHRQQVGPVEAGGRTPHVPPEGAVAVADAMGDEAAGAA